MEFSTRCQSNSCNPEKALRQLDKNLAPVAYLGGSSVTLSDFAVWGMIRGTVCINNLLHGKVML
jgi:hypothetical protein